MTVELRVFIQSNLHRNAWDRYIAMLLGLILGHAIREGTSSDVKVKKLDWQAITGQFKSQWVLHPPGLVPQLRKA